MPMLEDAWIKRHGIAGDEDHYSQAGALFRLMDDEQKNQLVTTIAEGLVHASESARQRMLEQFARADAAYAEAVKSAVERLRLPA